MCRVSHETSWQSRFRESPVRCQPWVTCSASDRQQRVRVDVLPASLASNNLHAAKCSNAARTQTPTIPAGSIYQKRQATPPTPQGPTVFFDEVRMGRWPTWPLAPRLSQLSNGSTRPILTHFHPKNTCHLQSEQDLGASAASTGADQGTWGAKRWLACPSMMLIARHRTERSAAAETKEQ